jgi:signal transduction histidine kinase
MWLRLALNLISIACIFSACSSPDRQAADKLNSLSYAYHYRNIDSTEHYARLAYAAADGYHDACAEALNNLAFVSLVRMQYDLAEAQLDSVAQLTDNQLELLVANVQQMRLCQRRSRNREFYDYREQALRSLSRINEERDWLTMKQLARLRYAESELAIVTSTYYYYVGLEELSSQEMQLIGPDVELDTAQWMNYLYNIGAGGIITQDGPAQVEQQEFECLMHCYQLATEFHSPYFLANSLEGLAEHLMGEESCNRLSANNPMAIETLRATAVELEQLPISLAERALHLFQQFGDVYQIAGAYRTLASCYRERGEYEKALNYLELSLADTVIHQAPDLVASIREQLSVAFAAVNEKALSDYHRNIYLDLQEQTRQDRLLEARAGQLDNAVERLNILLLAIVFMLILLLASLRLFFIYYKKRIQRQEELDEIESLREETEEQLFIEKQKRQKSEQRNLEQRAKISMVNGIMPLIDRMLHDVRGLEKNKDQREERLQYVQELTEQINSQNDVLTHWIQLRQGELSLHIETFDLQPLFDLIAKSHRSFELSGLQLQVDPTNARVKADRVLTIFMLNTLADNARKFTPEGGFVHLSASEETDFVEISVSDTGMGIDEKELQHIFEHKLSGGHGFGLLNCKGIIEKYKKTSQLFSVCLLSAESKKGQGSRFFFRLPKGITRVLLLLFLGTTQLFANHHLLQQADNFADSTYYSNVNGTYAKTLDYADSCIHYLNQYYRELSPRGRDTLQLLNTSSTVICEVQWLHRQLPLNYNILLVLRNECAIAALALHEWDLYHYNNRIYTTLFKELSADLTLDEYCRRMQQLKSNRTVAIVLLVLTFIALLVAVIFQIVHILGRRADRQQQKQESLDMLTDELHRVELEEARLHVSNQVLENCLSTLKHETMYYPSRIQNLINSGDISALNEVISYYRELYGILSEQAGREVQGIQFVMRPLEHDILGNANLIDELFDILRKQAQTKQLFIHYECKDDSYVICKVNLEGVFNVSFHPTIGNIPYLLCRQIVREHGEATGRHACGMMAEQTESGTMITITLPRAKRKV